MPSRARRFLAALLILAAGASPSAASAAAPPSIVAAREALALSDERLELMDEVMASKWFSRAPIEDPAQEAAVTAAAVAAAQGMGIAPAGVRALFGAEIEAAKEVQLGWGSHWLYFGAPPDLAAPELAQVRSQLSGISERLVAVLPGLVRLVDQPDAGRRVSKAATRVLRVRYLGAEGRAGIAAALLAIRR